LKITRLLRYAYHVSLRRTEKYASFFMITRALHSGIFEQPVKKYFFNTLLMLRWYGRAIIYCVSQKALSGRKNVSSGACN
jgi:hypothetical protein